MASTKFVLELFWIRCEKIGIDLRFRIFKKVLVQIFELYDFTSHMPLDSDRAAPHEQRLAETVLTSPRMCAGSC